MNEISVSIKEAPESLLAPSPCEDIVKGAGMKQDEGLHQNATILPP